MARHVNIDADILQAAIVGYRSEADKIQAKMDEITRRLSGRNGRRSPAPAKEEPPKKRKLNAAARRRIAAAQKKWAAYRKAKKAEA
jgi:hypothetical protein